jgi:hypothetical protein
MDTDGAFYELTGGDDELKHRMNMGNCAAQRFNFVERFNSITTTECTSSTGGTKQTVGGFCGEGQIPG